MSKLDLTTKRKYDLGLNASKTILIIGIIVVVFGMIIAIASSARIAQLSGDYMWFEEWSYETGGTIRSNPVVGDINGDSEMEIVVTSYDTRIYALKANTGTVVWSYSAPESIYTSPVLGDIDGDSELEVLFECYQTLYALEGSHGTLLWNVSFVKGITGSPVLGDLDGDSELDVVVRTNDILHALEGINGSQMWNYSMGSFISYPPAIGDIAGDALPEVLFVNENTLYALNGQNGSYLWHYETGEYIQTSPAIGDIDGDNNTEVIIGDNNYVSALKGNNGDLVWNFLTGGNVITPPVIADIDGNGDREIITGSDDDTLYVLKGVNGNQIWTYPRARGVSFPVALGDFDANGILDILIGGSSDQIKILEGRTGSCVWSLSVGRTARGSPSLTDINDDGIFDIIIGSYDNNVYAFTGELGPRKWVFTDFLLGIGTLIAGIVIGMLAIAVYIVRKSQLRKNLPTELNWSQQSKILREFELPREMGGKEDAKYNIQTNNLIKIYRNKLKKECVVAVGGIDLLVKKGVHGFLGPNGAGKTTTIKMLIGALSITSGYAAIKGYDVGSIKADKLVGYMPQEMKFYGKMSGEQYLIHTAQLNGISKENAMRSARYFLAKFNLEEVADRQVKQYSSGMRQKLGLAASMIGLPEILILDEPTSDLDPIGRSKIISYIKELSQDTSIFVSSHILSEIEQMCDTVTIINNGKIVLTDTVENVKKLYGDGSYRYIIDTTNNEKTLQYLKGEKCIENITIDPATDMIQAITTDSSALEETINQLIMSQDIFLRRFTPQDISLEDIFLELIDSEEKE